MTYLVLQVDWTSHRSNTWHEVWSGVGGENATRMALHFACLNELPTMILQMRSTAGDRATPMVVGGYDQKGNEWMSDEVGE